jgi:coatomer subunit epsilon
MGDQDPLFALRNKFHFGAYQIVANEASNLDRLSPAEQIERDVLIYRSYVALGSYDVIHLAYSAMMLAVTDDRTLQLVIAEVSESSPMALQAVKLLAEYLCSKKDKVRFS